MYGLKGHYGSFYEQNFEKNLFNTIFKHGLKGQIILHIMAAFINKIFEMNLFNTIFMYGLKGQIILHIMAAFMNKILK